MPFGKTRFTLLLFVFCLMFASIAWGLPSVRAALDRNGLVIKPMNNSAHNDVTRPNAGAARTNAPQLMPVSSFHETLAWTAGDRVPAAFAATLMTSMIAADNVVGWSSWINFSTAAADLGITANNGVSVLSAPGATNPISISDAGDGAGQRAFTTGWASGANTKSWRFSFSTANYGTLKFSCRMMGTNNFTSFIGPRDFKLQYSLDGSSWTDVSGGTLQAGNGNGNYNSLSNVSLPAACENQATVYLQMLMTSNTGVNGSTVSGGQSHIDDILVTGISLPVTTLGNYANTSVTAGSSTTITPSAAPANATSTTATASSGFGGLLVVNPTTGVVRVMNAQPAGTHTITVKAFGSSSATKTFTLTVNNPTACTSTSFSGAANVSVSTQPFYVALGDVNGDGKLDVTTANYGSNTVSIRLGNGDGTFSGTTEVSVGTNPGAVVLGDVNGDGKLDFATANINSNNVSIQLGNGDGTFSSSTSVNVGSQPYFVALGDVNGDGKLDLVVANANSNTVSIRLGDGTGSFSGSTNVSVGTQPVSVALGDFNADGKLDFVTANYGNNTVSIRLGDGAGNFSGSTNMSISGSPDFIAVGDVNNDGKLDFVTANYGNNTASIRLGDGAGNFSGSTNVSVGNQPYSVTLGDVNGDGKLDVATANYASNTVSIRLGDGAGNFSGTMEVTAGSNPGSVALGDLNGDGKLDMAASNLSGSDVSIQLNSCTSNTAPAITAGSALARTQGASASNATIATVSDTETAAGSLSVTTTTVPTGITVSNIVNTNGTITADVAAGCTAATGANTVVLTVTDGGSMTATANLTVNVASNAVSISTHPATQTVTAGNSVSFTAAASGTPTPTVQWQVSTNSGSSFSNISGETSTTLTFTTSAPQNGNQYRAVFSNSCGTSAATNSATLTVTSSLATTTGLTSSVNPSVFGQSVTFTATVSASSGTPTGTITFKDGSTTLGTGTLSSGVATFSISALSVGSHSITAEYGGASGFSASTSSAVIQVVNQTSTTATVASSTNPAILGQSVTLTATVSAVAPGAGTPSGTVTFKDGSTTLGTGTLSSGQATFSTASLTVGSHSLTVIYGGDTNFAGSTSSALTQTISTVSTTTALTSSANPSVFGQSVTLTATVSGSGGTPTGTVTFKDGATTLGTGTLNGSGVAILSISALSVSSHSLTVVYGGDSTFAASTSSTLTQTVNQSGTSTALASSLNPAIFGQSVTFTATASAISPGAGTPSGTVTFMNGSTTLGTGTLSSGQATLTTTSLGVGSHSITVVYGGDSNFNGSTSSALSQVVSKTDTSATLASSANPSVFGQSITLTATITGNGGTPSGTVTFKDGATTLGTGTLNGSGVATLSTSTLSVGSHSLTAQYGGDSTFASSTSSALSQTVNKVDQTITFGTLANKTWGDQAFPISATASSTLAVSFSVVSGPATISNNTVTITGAGTVKIRAAQAGDASYNAATDVDQTFTVSKATVTVTAADKSKTYGDANPALTYTYSGFVNSETAAVLSGAPSVTTTATTASGVGNYTITSAVGTLAASNYQFSFVNGTLAVNPATLTVTADSKTKIYGAANPTFTASYSGFVNNETASVLSGVPDLTTTATTASGAANYTITAAVGTLSASNYSFTFVNGTLSVNKATLTVTADNKTRLYGAANPTLTATLTGFVNNETSNVVSGTPALTTTATQGSAVGGYPITAAAGTLTAANYDFAFSDGTLAVTTVALTVTAENKTRAYGTANPALTFTYSGFVNGDTAASLTGAPVLTTTATTASNVGDYAITVAQGTLSTGNYALQLVDGTLSVTKVPLSVAAANQTKVYGSANPALTGMLTGVVNKDNITASYATTANAASGAGSYAITPTLNDPGSKLGNYDVTINNGALTITPAAVTVTAENKARIYGAENPTFTATYNGLIGEDTLSGRLVFSTTANSSSPVGAYEITLAGVSSPNYTITFVPGTLTINKAMLTVTAENKSRSYGVANPPLTATFAGFVNGESRNVLTGSPALVTTATQGSGIGSYPITAAIGDLAAGNYEFSFVDGSLTIGKATLTVTADELTKVYGSANPTLTYNISGFSNGENASVVSGVPSLTTTATSSSHVGNYPVSITAGTLSAANYELTFVAGKLNVTPAPLTVTAESRTRVYGTANPTLTANFTGLVNGDTMNLVAGSVTLTTTALPNSPVGTYPIVASGVTNPDYTVTYVNGTLTITPSQPSLTLTASLAPSALGQIVTFTASTGATTPFGGVPGGAITFTVDGKSLSPFVLNAAGQASFTSSTLAIGSHTISVSYGGDNNYQSSSKELTQEVSKATSFTTLTTPANPISTGQRLTLTAKVKGSASQPQGQVEFFDGEQSVGKAALANGVANFTVNELSAGTHALKAVYLGSETSTGSSSAVLSQQVTTDCTFTLAQKEFMVEPQGGKIVVKLDTRGGCFWTVGIPPSWIDVWSPDIVNGQWVTTLVIAPQTEPKIRVAKITFAGQEVTITQSRPMATVQAASYDGQSLAGDTIASIFGTNLASGVESATSQPLPAQLGGVRVKLRDSQGNEKWASLLYVSELQINFLVPSGMAEGELVVTVVKEDVETSAGKFTLETVAPGVFAADASGAGLAAGQIQRVRPDGSQSFASTAEYNPVTKSYNYLPINLNTSTSLVSDEVYLVLFGTGWRNRSSLQNVRAIIGGQEAQVVYAGAQPQYAGLDQANILLPQSLAGAGLVDIVLYVDGKVSNTVKIYIQ